MFVLVLKLILNFENALLRLLEWLTSGAMEWRSVDCEGSYFGFGSERRDGGTYRGDCRRSDAVVVSKLFHCPEKEVKS